MSSLHDEYRINPICDNKQQIQWGEVMSPKQPGSLSEVLYMDLEHNAPLAERRRRIELDLHDCVTIDSRGVAMLVFLNRRLKACGADWYILDPPATLERMLHLLNLKSEFKIALGGDALIDRRPSQEVELTDWQPLCETSADEVVTGHSEEQHDEHIN